MPARRPEPVAAVAHTLTLDFGRVLSEAEWRDLIGRVRQLPYVQRLRVDAVPRSPAVTRHWDGARLREQRA
jgi:hypothetical protein